MVLVAGEGAWGWGGVGQGAGGAGAAGPEPGYAGGSPHMMDEPATDNTGSRLTPVDALPASPTPQASHKSCSKYLFYTFYQLLFRGEFDFDILTHTQHNRQQYESREIIRNDGYSENEHLFMVIHEGRSLEREPWC